MKILILLVSFFGTLCAWAGLSEIELGMNYKSSKINEFNYQETLSQSGSYAYYFMQNSAVEFSYTRGNAILSIKGSSDSDPKTILKTNLEIIGVDFVIAFAPRSAMFQPSLKVGVAQINKSVFREAEGQGTDKIAESSGIVPSAGASVRLRLSQTFGIKLGLDMWTSPISEEDENDSLTLDSMGRASVSWVF